MMIPCPFCKGDIEYYDDRNNIITLDGNGNTIVSIIPEYARLVKGVCDKCNNIIPANYTIEFDTK